MMVHTQWLGGSGHRLATHHPMLGTSVTESRYSSDILSQLVSWSLTSIFSTNMAISEMKGQGEELSLPS